MKASTYPPNQESPWLIISLRLGALLSFPSELTKLERFPKP